MMMSPLSNSEIDAFNAQTTAQKNGMNAKDAQDRFMKLLVSQINNQDPLNPMDNAEMTSQIAQINTVTGIQQVNETIKSIAEQFSAAQMLQGSSMVGRDVLVEGNRLHTQAGQGSGAFELTGAADAVTVFAVAPGGQVVASRELGGLAAGRHDVAFDTSSYSGTAPLTLRVMASRASLPVEATPLERAEVASVGLDNGALSLRVQGRSQPVPYSGVRAIY